MEATLGSLFGLYTFSTGRRLFALRQVQKLATGEGLTDLASHANVCIVHDSSTRELEAHWAGRKVTTFSPKARQLDIFVDAALMGLRDGTEAAINASAPGDPLAEQAKVLLKELFPKGAGTITKLGFVEELAEVNRIVARLQKDDAKALTKELGLSRHVARLVQLEEPYREALEGTEPISFAKVRDARTKGQSLMLQAVAMVLGKYPSDEEADIAGREKLLGPIFVQNEAIKRYLRERRAIEDVDPETGEVEATEAGEGAEGGGAKPEETKTPQ